MRFTKGIQVPMSAAISHTFSKVQKHLWLILAAAGACLHTVAHAQAVRTASKSADISVFAGYERVHPDYGPYSSNGGMFGVDLTHYFHFPVVPSLEFRANINSNIAVQEHTYLVGFRAAVPFRRIVPYANFLVGPGFINFPYNIGYTHDDSKVYSYGGGVELPVTHGFALKLDAQEQHWNTGEFTYTPTLGTVGIAYTIPFRPHIHRRDY